MEAVPYKHKLFVLGDFNARVGRDYKVSSKVTGRHGIGGENANGSILPDLCVKPTPSSNRPTSIKPVGSIRAPTIGILLITYLLGKSQDRVPNADVLRTCQMPGIEALLLQAQFSMGLACCTHVRQPHSETDTLCSACF